MADSTPRAREALKQLPSIDELIAEFSADRYRLNRAQVLAVMRSTIAAVRKQILANEIPPEVASTVRETVATKLQAMGDPTLRPVINGTGIILHTGLGRAPLGRDFTAAAMESIAGYTHLEFDLKTGKRGQRLDLVNRSLPALTGADGAVVVNNNAAAVLLMLNAVAEGKEVIISRGQQVEIGGSFRIPDVIVKAGAKMVEVGTTNRTHLKDYEKAITKETAALLYVHPSNYRVEGFTLEVTVKELAALAKRKKIPLLVDLGSGSLLQSIAHEVRDEPTVAEMIKAGADLASFSGDKLLGGPQSGIIVGKQRWLNLLTSNPLYRALRVDKVTLALLDQALRSYVDDKSVRPENLTQYLFLRDRTELQTIAQRLCEMLPASLVKDHLTIVESEVEAGSGSLPGALLPSVAIRIDHPNASASKLAAAFRLGSPPVVGYINRKRFAIDLKAVPEADITALALSIGEVLSSFD